MKRLLFFRKFLKNLVDLSRKFGEIFREIRSLHLSGAWGTELPEASEFIKILGEKSMETFNVKENFHQNETFCLFEANLNSD